MILARLALESDRKTLAELGAAHYAEQQPGVAFDMARANRTFDNYLALANPTIIVAERDREVVGFLVATVHDYAAKDGHFTRQEVIYVRPNMRGTRSAAKLIEYFYSWSDKIGASEYFSCLAID